MLRCCECGRDMDAIGQDNMSDTIGYPLCEDCSGFTARKSLDKDYEMYCKEQYDDYCKEQEIYVMGKF